MVPLSSVTIDPVPNETFILSVCTPRIIRAGEEHCRPATQVASAVWGVDVLFSLQLVRHRIAAVSASLMMNAFCIIIGLKFNKSRWIYLCKFYARICGVGAYISS
ncbi:MAG: hypothetical protein CMP10_10210 [Zetaproteobacteria bacterium]|nr:hypothetical protein [Pseudobdellovibrionaceae bacterium]